MKSAQQMVVTAEDLQAASIDLPILVGGAALSEKFTAKKIQKVTDSPVIYAKDAMNGLSIVTELLDLELREGFLEKNRRNQERISLGGSTKTGAAVAQITLPQFFHHEHHGFWFESIPAWGSLYGLVSCVLIIVVSKFLGKAWLMRREDHYDS